MKLSKQTIAIEIALANFLDYRKNLIVTNISKFSYLIPFEVDLLCITESGYCYGFEIKISKHDLYKELNKYHYKHAILNGNDYIFNNYYKKFKGFSYVMPYDLIKYAYEILDKRFGIYSYNVDDSGFSVITCHRESEKISNYKWNENEKFMIARLGCMKLFNLKSLIKDKL